MLYKKKIKSKQREVYENILNRPLGIPIYKPKSNLFDTIDSPINPPGNLLCVAEIVSDARFYAYLNRK